jgi:hypothetical protein
MVYGLILKCNLQNFRHIFEKPTESHLTIIFNNDSAKTVIAFFKTCFWLLLMQLSYFYEVDSFGTCETRYSKTTNKKTKEERESWIQKEK